MPQVPRQRRPAPTSRPGLQSHQRLRLTVLANSGRMTMANKHDKRRPRSKYQQSLRMLKTKEGQLNAVFACYGSAMQNGQLFEQALSDFLSKYNELANEELSPSELLSEKEHLKKQTVGRLLHFFENKVKIADAEIHSHLINARNRRNMLAHEHFLIRVELFKTYDGRMKLLQELVSIESDIRTATNLVNGMRVAVEQALNGGSCDRTDSETLFTFELQFPTRMKDTI